MTKTQELDALRDLAARLGPDSYLGPWLASILPAVESSIRSDIIPLGFDPVAASRDALALLAQAREDADGIRAAAKKERERIIEQATKDGARRLEDIRHALRVALVALERA